MLKHLLDNYETGVAENFVKNNSSLTKLDPTVVTLLSVTYRHYCTNYLRNKNWSLEYLPDVLKVIDLTMYSFKYILVCIDIS